MPRLDRSTRALAAALSLAAIAPAQTLVRSVNGPAANAQYGTASIVVPDQNGDGFEDLLVGAPGFDQERGEVVCLSGAFLATGTGTQNLWTCVPAASPGDRFGQALADVGDCTGDGVRDFVVGQPGYSSASSSSIGAVRLVDGAGHTALSLIAGTAVSGRLGTAVAAIGDATGDGRSEVAVGQPGLNTSFSFIYVLDGALLLNSLPAPALSTNYSVWTGSGSDEFAAALAPAGDLDNDGVPDFLIGAPGYLGGSGMVLIATLVASGGIGVKGVFSSPVSSERCGSSLDIAADFDGDGMRDFVAGAPNSPNGTIFEVGRAVVISTARVIAQTPPYELLSFSTPGSTSHATPSNYHFGAAVHARDDLNGDGAAELLVGAPDFYTTFPSAPSRGFVDAYSGATGLRLAHILGQAGDQLGDTLAGAIDDLDGDGFKEFVVAGSRSDAGGTDSGVVKCFRLFPILPSTYCTGKVNSLGCTPAIAFSGSPSPSSLTPFPITATNFINQKNGLLFYSHSATTTSFQGGFKCAGDPVRRTAVLNSGGSTSGSSCTGAYDFDFNERIRSGVDPSLVSGAEVFAQYWSRDPGSVSHTSLSNALRFVINL